MIEAELYAEGPDLALSRTIRSRPEATIEVVSDAATDPQHRPHLFRIEAPSFEPIEDALSEDHTVASFVTVVEGEDDRTYRIEYADRAKLLTPKISELDGLTLGSMSHAKGWHLRLQLPDHDALYELDRFADEEGIRLEILGLQQIDEGEALEEFGLTEPQREALVSAFVNGYYDDPREASLEDVAEELGITPSAASGRLRRGSTRLIEAALLEDDESWGPDRLADD